MRIDIEKHLGSLSEQGDLFFCPNKGNAGDSLIATATFCLFEHAGIPYQLFDQKRFESTGKVVVLGGGGSLVPEHDSARLFVEKHHRAAKRLVILPHTIAGNEDLLGQLGSNVDIITREEVSFHHVKKAAPAANVFLAEDLAFRLDPAKILSQRIRRPFLHISLKQLARRECALLRESKRRKRGVSKNLDCFRTDKERTDIPLPKRNLDLSKLFKCGVDTPSQALAATVLVFRFINQYEEIRTNRLHLAIAGALLGKRVQFYANSYFKNEAVYHFSMEDRFPNVQWMGA